jgi:hypothetical protein
MSDDTDREQQVQAPGRRTPDIQYFPASGTWLKPAGAIRADVVLCGPGGGGAFGFGSIGADGGDGEITVQSFAADYLPDEMAITVGKGGRGAGIAGDGADGYALVITHLTPAAPVMTERTSGPSGVVKLARPVS